MLESQSEKEPPLLPSPTTHAVEPGRLLRSHVWCSQLLSVAKNTSNWFAAPPLKAGAVITLAGRQLPSCVGLRSVKVPPPLSDSRSWPMHSPSTGDGVAEKDASRTTLPFPGAVAMRHGSEPPARAPAVWVKTPPPSVLR